jgi:hypothetical protein
MKRRAFISLVGPLAVVSLVTACGDDRKAVLGKWQSVDTPETLEFLGDGSVVAVQTKLRLTLSGTWSYDGGTFIVKLQAPFNTVTMKAKLQGKDLIVTDPAGAEIKFKRI